MAVVDDFTHALAERPATPRSGLPRRGLLRARFVALASALAAGWRAAAEYRRLSGMSPRELGRHGLAPGDIPHEIYQRHFAGLRGWLHAAE